MDAQLAEGIGLVAFRLHEGRWVIPVPGGLESTASGSLDKRTAIRLVHTDIGIHEVTICSLKCFNRSLYCLRLIPVITVNNTNDFSGCITDAFIHSIVDAAVRFT